MVHNTVKLITQVNGTVEAIRNVLGVVTDNYNDLQNKPSINGVELRGNMNLEELKILEPAGPSVYVYPRNVGDTDSLRVEELGIYTFGRNFQLADLILTQDKKVFFIDGFEVPDSSDGSEAGEPVHIASLFWDLG